jgi:predicted RNA-binding protein YlxR (DUF448 family)
MRTCIACRNVAEQAALLRFVRAPDGEVWFDVQGTMESRGAYTCPTPSCIARAVERGAFKRAFEAPVIVDAAALERHVGDTLEAESLRALGLARRQSLLAPGRSETLRWLQAGDVTCVVAATDLAPRSRQQLEGQVGETIPLLEGPTKVDIGSALGRRATGVVGLGSGRPAERVIHHLRRLARLRNRKDSTQAALRDRTGERMSLAP